MRTQLSEFSLAKRSRTYADTLEVLGLAHLIRSIHPNSSSVRISDEGARYVVTVTPELTRDDVLNWKVSPCYPFIELNTKGEVVPAEGRVFHYAAERERERIWRQGRQRRNELKGADDDSIGQAPSAELGLVKTLNTMRKGSTAFNQLWWAIAEAKDLPAWLAWRLGFDDVEPELVDGKRLMNAISPLQMFNPVIGKGTNRTKASGTGLGSFPKSMLDWFREWLKYQGMYVGMVGYFTGPGQSDNKLAVIAPEDVELGVVIRIREGLLRLAGGPVKLDIAAVHGTLRELVQHSPFESEVSLGLLKLPSAVIKGIHVAYFTSLGSASAVTNVSFLGLPGWLPISSVEERRAWEDMLEEHRKCVATLKEDSSSDMEILIQYRAALSTGRLSELLDFLSMYAIRLMQLRSQSKPAYVFSEDVVRGVLMSYKLEEIIDDVGFRQIAKAIRKSTIDLQSRKGKPSTFQVKYGLAQDWRRKAKRKEEFVIAVAEFVQEYNSETQRAAEMDRDIMYRHYVTEDDLNNVIFLIEKHGSELISALLLAYGYARNSRKTEVTQTVGGATVEP